MGVGSSRLCHVYIDKEVLPSHLNSRRVVRCIHNERNKCIHKYIYQVHGDFSDTLKKKYE